MNTVHLQIRKSDGEVHEEKEIPIENALRTLMTHDWPGELARAEGMEDPDYGQFIIANVTASNGDDLLIYPQDDGTFNIVYLRSPVSGVPMPEGKSRPHRLRDELSLNALAEVVARFAADDREWMIASTASFARCVVAFISLPALIIGFLAGGIWYLPQAMGFSMSKNLSLFELAGLMVWSVVLLSLAVGLWLLVGRHVFTRSEAQFAWSGKFRIDRWIFDRVFPEAMTVDRESGGRWI